MPLMQLRDAPVPDDVHIVPGGCLHGHEIPLQLAYLPHYRQHLPSAPATQVTA
jgi:hypothetical protein